MPQFRLVKYKIKPGKKHRWLDWCSELKRREKEVMKSLKNENVIQEACFLSDDSEHVYYFTQTPNLLESKAAADNSGFELDEQHRHIAKECLELVEAIMLDDNVKILFNFENNS